MILFSVFFSWGVKEPGARSRVGENRAVYIPVWYGGSSPPQWCRAMDRYHVAFFFFLFFFRRCWCCRLLLPRLWQRCRWRFRVGRWHFFLSSSGARQCGVVSCRMWIKSVFHCVWLVWTMDSSSCSQSWVQWGRILISFGHACAPCWLIPCVLFPEGYLVSGVRTEIVGVLSNVFGCKELISWE